MKIAKASLANPDTPSDGVIPFGPTQYQADVPSDKAIAPTYFDLNRDREPDTTAKDKKIYTHKRCNRDHAAKNHLQSTSTHRTNAMMRYLLFSTLLVASYLTLAQPAHAIGYNYDYSNNVYYGIQQKKHSQQSTIYKIDFEKKSYSKVLSFSSSSGWLNLSPNKNLISYYTNHKQYI